MFGFYGAAAGALFDLATIGPSTGIPTAVGAGVGAVTAFVVGKRRPELKLNARWLPGGLRLGGRAQSVGPYAALNFPWILLDRALGVFAYVINRAHARRDEATIHAAPMHSAMSAAGLTTARWPARHTAPCAFSPQAAGRARAGARAEKSSCVEATTF